MEESIGANILIAQNPMSASKVQALFSNKRLKIVYYTKTGSLIHALAI